ncbi:MAG TPA: cyclic nucleotide-binding domain-containing protein [Gammaproteobacteria bacterium]
MFCELDAQEWQAIRQRGAMHWYGAGERIFSEGDEADYIYFIDAGRVVVFIEKFNTREDIQTLGAGDWLGEMALYHNNIRTASVEAVEETRLLRVRKEAFLAQMAADAGLARKINDTLSRRSEELVLREKLIDLSGLGGADRHIGIKGDPSLRESAMTRERYESVVDLQMPRLLPVFKDLLLNRCAYRLFIGFNNGEIRISTLYDPFGQEYHSAARLVDEVYVERHFPRVDYAEKARMIRSHYQMVAMSPAFAQLPNHLHQGFSRYFADWRPVPADTVAMTLDSLPQLRTIPNFYVRNATIDIVKDAIHLQFNCDGSHILSAEGYRRFLRENI